MKNVFPVIRGALLGNCSLLEFLRWSVGLITPLIVIGVVAAWTLIVLGIAIHFQTSFVDSAAERESFRKTH
jgi:hypothetical protein